MHGLKGHIRQKQKMTKREIELLRDLGHLRREIMEMTDDEARQILDRAESSEDDEPQTM